jgi:hypothetical protein
LKILDSSVGAWKVDGMAKAEKFASQLWLEKGMRAV